MTPTTTLATTLFKVELKQMDSISATLPVPEDILPLSNLDLLLPPFNVSVFFCYNTNGDQSHIGTYNSSSFSSKVAVLKKSLAQTLVLYYPFAGEITMNSAGEPLVMCNNRGVDFFQAYANVDLIDLNLHNPDESIEGKMVPNKTNGTLAIQVYVQVSFFLPFFVR